MKISFLGTNGWYDSPTGNTICILLTTSEYHIVFDAGYGLSKLDEYIRRGDERPVFLFLSHFHMDHIAGFHTLAKFRFARGLDLCIPRGGRPFLDTLLNQPFTVPLAELPYSVRVRELPDDQADLPFSVEARPLRHASFTLGFRLQLEGKTVTYCPDTGYCANAVELSRSADLLIAECAYRSGRSNEAWPHLNPESAAQIAKESGAHRLVLVHFDALQYPTLADRERAAEAARVIFPETVASTDGMEVIV